MDSWICSFFLSVIDPAAARSERGEEDTERGLLSLTPDSDLLFDERLYEIAGGGYRTLVVRFCRHLMANSGSIECGQMNDQDSDDLVHSADRGGLCVSKAPLRHAKRPEFSPRLRVFDGTLWAEQPISVCVS
jgi:hypothetical protein